MLERVAVFKALQQQWEGWKQEKGCEGTQLGWLTQSGERDVPHNTMSPPAAELG